jgi:chromosome segregation ATPase
MYELNTEREQLMQKVDAQSNYIEKADATAKAQAKQLLDQNKRIKQLEEEIQHVKTTQMIDKFARKNIHGPREKGHMSEEETHNKKVSGDNLSETTQRSEQIKKTTKSVKSSSNKLSVAQPHFSKLSTYGESGDW